MTSTCFVILSLYVHQHKDSIYDLKKLLQVHVIYAFVQTLELHLRTCTVLPIFSHWIFKAHSVESSLFDQCLWIYLVFCGLLGPNFVGNLFDTLPCKRIYYFWYRSCQRNPQALISHKQSDSTAFLIWHTIDIYHLYTVLLYLLWFFPGFLECV